MRILIEENKVEIAGTKEDCLAGLTQALHAIYVNGMADKDEIEKVCRVALMSSKELAKAADEVDKNVSRLKDQMHKRVLKTLEKLTSKQMDELSKRVQEEYEDGISEDEFNKLVDEIKEEV